MVNFELRTSKFEAHVTRRRVLVHGKTIGRMLWHEKPDNYREVNLAFGSGDRRGGRLHHWPIVEPESGSELSVRIPQ